MPLLFDNTYSTSFVLHNKSNDDFNIKNLNSNKFPYGFFPDSKSFLNGLKKIGNAWMIIIMRYSNIFEYGYDEISRDIKLALKDQYNGMIFSDLLEVVYKIFHM